MEVLKHFPEDFSEALQTSFFILSFFNIRYLQDELSFIQKNWRFSYLVLIVIIHVVTLGLHLPDLVTGDEMSQFAYLIPSILVTVHGIFKCFVLLPKTKEVSTFLRELGSLWRVQFTETQKQEKDKLLWRLHLVNRVSYWISIFGTSQYMLSPLVETLIRKFILRQESKLILPFDSVYPFNPTKNWFIYIITYIFQFYSLFLLVTVYSGASLIMVTSCGLLTTEFMMLKDDLTRVKPRMKRGRNKVSKTDDDEPTIEQFVARHQKLLRLSRLLDNAFNGMVFIDLLFVGITVCAFGFMGQFTRSTAYKLLSYLGVVSSLLNVLYLCYYGEQLTSASSAIGDMAYENLWYKGEKKYKMTIWLIIKIGQNPCRLTSLRYADVSLKMFTSVVSSTWSYFSLMNSVYSEEEV
uniref:Odorant receptor n=1 Tax=Helicoverpa armigera TaxID=29058 RepID=A0A7T3N0P9_HELAM|nr:odorant receptor [Helicoverpa armigera]